MTVSDFTRATTTALALLFVLHMLNHIAAGIMAAHYGVAS